MSPCMQSRSRGGRLRAWVHSLTYPCSARTGRYFASAPSHSHPNLRVDLRAGIGQGKRTCPLPFSLEPSYSWPARKRGEEEDPRAASRIAHGPWLPSCGRKGTGGYPCLHAPVRRGTKRGRVPTQVLAALVRVPHGLCAIRAQKNGGTHPQMWRDCEGGNVLTPPCSRAHPAWFPRTPGFELVPRTVANVEGRGRGQAESQSG